MFKMFNIFPQQNAWSQVTILVNSVKNLPKNNKDPLQTQKIKEKENLPSLYCESFVALLWKPTKIS